MIDFREAVAVVTGGAGGIGRALAARLASEGTRVAVADLDLAAAEAVAKELPGAIGIAADVSDPDAVDAMVAQVEADLGPVDVYCSNAGLVTSSGLGSDADWDVSWNVHGMAHVYGARAVLPGMAARDRGAFVVTASAAGLLMSMASAPYTVTKHASVAIAEWLAVRHGGGNVQIHCLCPQGVRTPMVSADAEAEAEVAASGRIIEPDEVATAVVEAIQADRFLITPHPEVYRYERFKVDDRDRWLAGMRALLARLRAS
jgi:NAD(P)-dependent dehydrogenase (short-subunit alcohol dehydrogenase family)